SWHDDQVFFGCRNQWITPESVGETNPYYDTARHLAIVADAIIDNREELFERLQIARERAAELTDSELILLAYARWGEDSPKHLVGDFAYMIWDARSNTLFGARDFSGSRTLYYCSNQDGLAFCTTMRPLLALPGMAKRLNEEWLAQFLVIAGMVDTADTSITPYEGISQLPPAHSILVHGERLTLQRYCTLTAQQTVKFKSDDQYVDAFQDVFRQAVASRVRAGRQVASQLSGGLDSGSIVSFAARELRRQNKRLLTFSYVPPADFV